LDAVYEATLGRAGLSGSLPFRHLDKTADMRSDQAFDLIGAASGVLALFVGCAFGAT
jgi:hypothetical protein